MYRSLIFVPGNNRRFVEKAKTLQADIICLDLEDSVPANEKEIARTIISEAASQRSQYARPLYVRTNSPVSAIIEQDLKAVRQGIDGIVVPKVDNADDIKHIGVQLDPKIQIIPSIESAEGVVNAYQIASADIRINALVFGVFDFLHDIRVDYDENDDSGYSYARAKVAVDAGAAGIAAIDGIWQKIDDVNGLVNDSAKAKRLGYSGKSIIHPSQIQPVHKVFRPSKSEIEWAKKVVEALADAMERGSGRGAVRLDGKMIDAVHYKQAKTILDEEAKG
jgi:citrate lyase subunit beta/citryl-CoA lyase